jgi:hypothetical protein
MAIRDGSPIVGSCAWGRIGDQRLPAITPTDTPGWRAIQSSSPQAQVKRLLSSEHFSVDGTLIEAWASIKSFKPQRDRFPSCLM